MQTGNYSGNFDSTGSAEKVRSGMFGKIFMK